MKRVYASTSTAFALPVASSSRSHPRVIRLRCVSDYSERLLSAESARDAIVALEVLAEVCVPCKHAVHCVQRIHYGTEASYICLQCFECAKWAVRVELLQNGWVVGEHRCTMSRCCVRRVYTVCASAGLGHQGGYFSSRSRSWCESRVGTVS